MARRPRFPFRISVQTVLPSDFETNEPFHHTVEGLRDLGLWGIELNIRDLDDSRTKEASIVEEYLARFDLRLSMFASGLTAKTLGISLSAIDGRQRETAVHWAKRMVDWTAAGSTAARNDETPTGIIIGFLKGGVVANPEEARRSLVSSLSELLPYAEEKGVPLILEATNRYESSVANSLSDTAAIIDEVLGSSPSNHRTSRGDEPALQILPDTFHMNIEEANMTASLTHYADYYRSLHLSDNNRLFPAFGAIDFRKIFTALAAVEYRGRLAIEGNIKNDLVSDLRASVDHLTPLIEERRG